MSGILPENKKVNVNIRKITWTFFLCFAIVLSALVFASCGSETKEAAAEFFVFDTVVDIKAYGDNGQTAVDAAKDVLYKYDSMFSATKEGSEIYKLNNNETTKVSEETAEIIEKSLKISELSQGSLDITVYPIVELWGFTGESCRVPEDSEIAEALSFVGYDKIALQNGEVIKENPKVQIDLGAVAKGYIGDKVAEAIRNAGCSSAVVSIGGNVVTVGKKPGGEKFSVGVTWTDGKGICAAAALSDISAVTSGTYQRNFTENGVFYHHIIDPRTGYPAQSDIGSVTIFSDDGLVADGLSTAFFVMGSERAAEFYQNEEYRQLGIESLDFMIIKNDGTCLVTENIYGDIKLNQDYIAESDVTVI